MRASLLIFEQQRVYKPMSLELQESKMASAVSFSWQFNYYYYYYTMILISLLLLLSCFSSYVFFSKFLSLTFLVLSTFVFFKFLLCNKKPKEEGKAKTADMSMDEQEEVLSSRDNPKETPEIDVSSCSIDSQPEKVLKCSVVNNGQENSETKVSSVVPHEMWGFLKEKGGEDYSVSQIKSLDSISENSCLSTSNSDEEDFELDLLSESDHYPCSDSNDEENLIEIALPEGNTLRPEETKIFRPNVPEYSPESFFGTRLMELFSELTEEDNLIEIDISMGSIKCPGFEIEA